MTNLSGSFRILRTTNHNLLQCLEQGGAECGNVQGIGRAIVRAIILAKARDTRISKAVQPFRGRRKADFVNTFKLAIAIVADGGCCKVYSGWRLDYWILVGSGATNERTSAPYFKFGHCWSSLRAAAGIYSGEIRIVPTCMKVTYIRRDSKIDLAEDGSQCQSGRHQHY